MDGSLCKLFDLILGFVHNLYPVVNDDLCKSSDEIDHADVKDRTCYKEHVKDLTREYHGDKLITHRHIVGELAESNERLLAGHGVEHYDCSHYESKVKGACLMDTVEKITPHHEDRVYPDTDIGRGVMSYMKEPGHTDPDDDYHDRPFLPSEKKGFDNEDYGEDRITDKKRKVGGLEQIVV